MVLAYIFDFLFSSHLKILLTLVSPKSLIWAPYFDSEHFYNYHEARRKLVYIVIYLTR